MFLAFAGAQATTLDVSKLAPEQVRELKATADKLQSERPTAVVVRQEAEAWAELGTNLAKATVAAAKELGVASSEFAVTDLGKVVTIVAVYKFLGRVFWESLWVPF